MPLFVQIDENGEYVEETVQIIMESLGGGGHLTMAGAQLSDCTLESARQRLFEAIDDYLSKNPRPAK